MRPGSAPTRRRRICKGAEAFQGELASRLTRGPAGRHCRLLGALGDNVQVVTLVGGARLRAGGRKGAASCAQDSPALSVEVSGAHAASRELCARLLCGDLLL